MNDTPPRPDVDAIEARAEATVRRECEPGYHAVLTMDPATVLAWVAYTRHLEAEVERLEATCAHSASLAESLAERLRFAWDRVARVEALAASPEYTPTGAAVVAVADLRDALRGAGTRSVTVSLVADADQVAEALRRVVRRARGDGS